MIVRCNGCDSAFAVDDAKIANKKFAFTCPKCSTENIIDNRISIKETVKPSSGIPAAGVAAAGAGAAVAGAAIYSQAAESKSSLKPADDMNFNIPEEKAPKDDLDFDLPDEKTPKDDLDFDAADKKAPTDDLDFDLPEEKAPADDLDFDIPEDKTTKDDLDFDSIDKQAPTDDLDFDAVDKQAPIDDLDFDLADKKISEKKVLDFSETALPSENEELVIPDLDEAADLGEFDDSSLDDIDNLDLDFDADMKETAKTIIDIESDNEEFVSFDDKGEVEAAGSNRELDLGADIEDKLLAAEDVLPDNFDKDSTLPISDELDNFDDLPVYDDKATDLDLPPAGDLEEINLDKEKISSSSNSSDINDDFLPLDEDDSINDSGKSKEKHFDDIDDFDIPDVIEEPSDGIKSEDIYSKTGSDDDITIDLDNLDIELEDDNNMPVSSETQDLDEPAASVLSDDNTETLDLESLDIDLEEPDSVLSGEKLEDDFAGFDDPVIDRKTAANVDLNIEAGDETLDLASLDIPLEETGEFKTGEEIIDEDDDKLTLTLDDAGLTMDELSMASIDENESPEEDEDELRLTIDEVDPSLGEIDTLEQDFKEAESVLADIPDVDFLSVGTAAAALPGKVKSGTTSRLMLDEIDDLPDIDLGDDIPDSRSEDDDFNRRIASLDSSDAKAISSFDSGETESGVIGAGAAAAVGIGALGAAATTAAFNKNRRKNDALDLKNEQSVDEVFELKDESDVIYPARKERNIDYKGSVAFSIDYSLFYSKIGALIRIFFIYFIGLLPHYLVAMLYTALSLILGFINNLVVISTGESVEDFAEIQENTLRYLLSIGASSIGLVEENPIFAGRKNIDYSLQMDIAYPIRSSKFLGMLRASFIGIMVISFPHLLISVILSIIVPVASFIGQISVLFTGKWPRLLFEFLTSYYRYQARVFAFLVGLIDEYPPFKF